MALEDEFEEAPPSVIVSPGPDPGWFEAYRAIHAMAPSDAGILWEMLNLDAGARWFGIAWEEDEPVSIGMAVQEGDWVGLYGLATVPERRGRGLCTQTVGALLDSARVSGARRAYLQVAVKNDSALRLYARLGFRELYRYWYRRTSEEGVVQG